MKRTILTLLSVVLLAALAVPTLPAAAGAKIDVTVVMHNARNEEIVWGIANRIKNDLEKNSKGEMVVKLLGPEVGGERDLQEGTSRNEFQIFQSGDMAVSTYGVKYAVMAVPFLFPGYDAVEQGLQGQAWARSSTRRWSRAATCGSSASPGAAPDSSPPASPSRPRRM